MYVNQEKPDYSFIVDVNVVLKNLSSFVWISGAFTVHPEILLVLSYEALIASLMILAVLGCLKYF